MSALVQREQGGALAAVSDQELMTVLQNSLYPGASPASIELVVGYCRAAGLDVMQKPVHIVPMWDSKARGVRDTILPGIGLYRIQAARTGQYVGMSEPQFGPVVSMNLGGVDVSFPEWCRITVRRQVGNVIAEFPAVEYWLENYASKGGAEKSVAPNAMWARRSYGQLAKCAEAQALRKGFPEVGSLPTAEEMEGKEYGGEREIPTATVVPPPTNPSAPKPFSPTPELLAARPGIIALLEAEAAKGEAARNAAWAALTREQRLTIGVPEWERIKSLTPAVIEAEFTEAKPATYAQIMAQLNAAQDVATLSTVIGQDMAHLTEQMRGELIFAAKAKMAKLEQQP